MAWEVLELAFGKGDLVIAGIEDQGYVLAEMLAETIGRVSDVDYKLTRVKIDKTSLMQSEVEIELAEEEYSDKWILMVDDVLNTGGTLAYALVPFLSVPTRGISVAVLVDREHHRFPVHADIKGLSLSTTLKERIEVRLSEDDCAVYLS